MMNPFVFLTVFAGFYLTSAGSSGWGKEEPKWKTGSALQSALNSKIRFQSTGELKKDLSSLSRNSQVGILLDREIDPGQRVEFPEAVQPLGKTLDEVAQKIKSRSIVVGNLIYLAPTLKANRLAMLRRIQSYQLTRLPDELRRKLNSVSELTWPTLSNPKDLVVVLANNVGLKFVNPELIQHDLWSEQSLPKLTVGDQLTLLLATMKLGYVIDPNSMTLKAVELDGNQTVTLKFSRGDARRIERLVAGKGLQAIQTVSRGNEFFTRGPVKQQLVIVDGLSPPRKWKTSSKSGAKDVFDLNTNATRGSILATIAKNRGVQLKFDPNLTRQLQQKIEIRVKQVGVEELIQKTLEGTALKFRLDDSQLLITK